MKQTLYKVVDWNLYIHNIKIFFTYYNTNKNLFCYKNFLKFDSLIVTMDTLSNHANTE